MSKKELSLIGQTFKTVRQHYKMGPKLFKKNIASIREQLDEMAGRTRYNSLIPEQVELIIKKMEGNK
ncbi:MAG TPA: hypothetical protein VGC65_00265 [Bacteroidia bacterium]|jgi:hypothetical protein